jgi:hypothetical protein
VSGGTPQTGAARSGPSHPGSGGARLDSARVSTEPASAAGGERRQASQGLGVREEESVGALRRVARPPRRDTPVPASHLALLLPPLPCQDALPARRSGDSHRRHRVVRLASGAGRREREVGWLGEVGKRARKKDQEKGGHWESNNCQLRGAEGARWGQRWRRR